MIRHVILSCSISVMCRSLVNETVVSPCNKYAYEMVCENCLSGYGIDVTSDMHPFGVCVGKYVLLMSIIVLYLCKSLILDINIYIIILDINTYINISITILV